MGPGIPFVISAPSGTGKTTVCRLIVAADESLEFSVSHTTRGKRPQERDGADYHFVSEKDFRKLIDGRAFVEWAEYSANLYGTSWASIDGPLAEGRDLVLEIEVQGAAQIRRRREDARFIFLLPPSAAELERRLRGRGTDSPEVIERRLALMQRELEAVHGFDYAVVNDDLDQCVTAVREIISAERKGAVQSMRGRFPIPPEPKSPCGGA